MKTTVKILSVLLAVFMLMTATACSGTESVSLGSSLGNAWAYRHGETEIPIGLYINYLSVALSDAQSRYEGDTDVTLETVIKDDDGKDVTVGEFTKAEAKEYCLRYIAMVNNAKDVLGDKMFTQADLDSYINDYFAQMESMYQMYGLSYSRDAAYSNVASYGVSSESYDMSIAYDYYYDAFFKGIYAEGGSSEVSNEEIEKYFNDNYTHYRYIKADYTTTVTQPGSDTDTEVTTDIDGDTKKAYQDLFAKVASETNSAETFENGVLSYMQEFEITTDPTVANTEILEDSTADEEILEAVKSLEDNTATTLEASDGSGLYLIFKGEISEYVDFLTTEIKFDTVTTDTEAADGTTDTASSDADTDSEPTYTVNEVKSNKTKDGLLYEIKEDEFEAYLDGLVEALGDKLEVNEKEINKYDASVYLTTAEEE